MPHTFYFPSQIRVEPNVNENATMKSWNSIADVIPSSLSHQCCGCDRKILGSLQEDWSMMSVWMFMSKGGWLHPYQNFLISLCKKMGHKDLPIGVLL